MHASLIRNIRAVVTISVFVMNEEEHHTKEEADWAHGYVRDAQEGVFSTHPGDGAEDHTLSAVEAADRIVWVQVDKEMNWIKDNYFLHC